MAFVARGFRHLRLGTIVSVEAGLIVHQGLVFGFDDFGIPIIGSIAQGRNFFYESFHDFMRGRTIYEYSYPSDLPGEMVLCEALSIAWRPYHWKDWNCQCFVRFAHGLEPKSPQAEALVGAAVLAGTLILAAAISRA